ncbi:MAG: exosortase-associated EpsI family protein [Kiritimatiellaeota bacterium]|nr:exosortase-associated EpsI family protein [Kiritimatiellota bacterium]
MKYKPFITVIVLLALTALALMFTVDVSLVDQPGVRLVLPAHLGPWRGRELRFCHNPDCTKDFTIDQVKKPDICPACGKTLHTMSLAEYTQLDKDTRFIKSLYTNAAGDSIAVSVVLSGRERESIHRPERCLEGQGHRINSSHVLAVPVAGRKPLGVMVLETTRALDLQGQQRETDGYFAYWFVGQGRDTPYHLERMFWLGWDRIVHSVAHKWAYIAVAGRCQKNSTPYQDQIKSLVGLLYPEIILARKDLAQP